MAAGVAAIVFNSLALPGAGEPPGFTPGFAWGSATASNVDTFVTAVSAVLRMVSFLADSISSLSLRLGARVPNGLSSLSLPGEAAISPLSALLAIFGGLSGIGPAFGASFLTSAAASFSASRCCSSPPAFDPLACEPRDITPSVSRTIMTVNTPARIMSGFLLRRFTPASGRSSSGDSSSVLMVLIGPCIVPGKIKDPDQEALTEVLGTDDPLAHRQRHRYHGDARRAFHRLQKPGDRGPIVRRRVRPLHRITTACHML